MLKNLLIDFVMFLQILFFAPYVLLVMLPLRYVDRVLGTRLFAGLVRMNKTIANL